MRRAGWIIYNLAIVVSLLLCLGTVGVWVRSGWVSDKLIWSDWPEDRSLLDVKTIWCSRGGVQFGAWHYLDASIYARDEGHFTYDREPATEYPTYGDELGKHLFTKPRRYAGRGFEWIPQTNVRLSWSNNFKAALSSLTLPLYFPTLLFALLPAHYFLRVRRRRRIASRLARGCCVFCGYDLRASAGRCPECGRESGLTGRPEPQTQAPAPPRH